ncbi:MAG: Mce protein [Mycobacterium sp.]|nr:Mce protein [Mycobacterium sp.]
MEGQQPDPGDLNDAETDVDDRADTDTDTDRDIETAADTDGPVVAPAKEPSQRWMWFRRNKRSVAVVASACLFVAAGGFAGAAVQPYLMDRATVATKYKIAQTAADAITTLWSYTPDNMDSLSSRSAKYLGGDFEEQYRKFVDAIAATNKQAQVTSATQVVGAGVESLRGDEASALVYTNTTSTTAKSNNIPSLQYLSYRLELKRYGRDWRVTKMTTVTSLDLTPKL